MKLIQLKCPNCGAELSEDESNRIAFCKYCGAKLMIDSEVQHVEIDDPENAGYLFEKGRLRAQQESSRQLTRSVPVQPQQVIINNYNGQQAVYSGRAKNKWVAFFLCLFLGFLGAHKFYEGKTRKGILYMFTAGLFFIGWLIDIIVLLFKPNPYYV